MAEAELNQHRRHRRRLVVTFAVVVLGSTTLLTVWHASRSHNGAGDGASGSKQAATPLRILGISPAPETDGIGYASPISIRFSVPIARHSPLPRLTPAVPGSWERSGRTLVFRPSGYYVPSSRISVHVPAGRFGPRGQDGDELSSAVNAVYIVQPGSTLRLQQLLAELDYLPVAFAPLGAGAASARAASALDGEATSASAVSIAPRPGSFIQRFAKIPTQLASTFTPGLWGVGTEGAVLAFQAAHNLSPDGEPGAGFWRSLLAAVASRATTSRPYDYVIVTETLPETLYVWQDGRVVFQTLANTGAPGASTPLGTWPVYLRYTSTTMSGVNPDGSHYSDPGVPWVSYFMGSDAVHGFGRAGYGYPQSDGCVELPIASAASVFPLDPVGTLVTVATGDLTRELHITPTAVSSSSPPTATTPATTSTATPPTTTPTTTATTTATTAATTTTTATAAATTSTTLPPATASSTAGPGTAPSS